MSTTMSSPGIATGPQRTSRPTTSTAADLLQRVQTIGPLLRAHADQGERGRRLPRAVHTLKHHAFASESMLQTVGQVYLGQPPEFFLVGF